MNDPWQPTPQTDERVLAVLGGISRISGFMGFKRKPGVLILTQHRIIFAGFSKEKQREIVRQARDGAKMEGKGVLGRWQAQLQAAAVYHQSYAQMTPEAALAEDVDNFALSRADITKLKFRAGGTDDTGSRPDRLIIKTSREKHTFELGTTRSKAKEVFRSAGYGV